MQTPEDAKALEPEAILEISELDQFVRLLMTWHSKKVSVLEHMLEIPEGTEVEFSGVGTFMLTGEARNGFQAGVSLALFELGRLPFHVTHELKPTPEDAPYPA
jgi:hypothetical protein